MVLPCPINVNDLLLHKRVVQNLWESGLPAMRATRCSSLNRSDAIAGKPGSHTSFLRAFNVYPAHA